jgi:hypothetical protein
VRPNDTKLSGEDEVRTRRRLSEAKADRATSEYLSAAARCYAALAPLSRRMHEGNVRGGYTVKARQGKPLCRARPTRRWNWAMGLPAGNSDEGTAPARLTWADSRCLPPVFRAPI